MWKQARELVGEKRITKQFEYDCPADLTLTFLSEVYNHLSVMCITCGDTTLPWEKMIQVFVWG